MGYQKEAMAWASIVGLSLLASAQRPRPTAPTLQPQSADPLTAWPPEAGGLPAIMQAFTQHIGHARMQSKAPLTIRNMVGRNAELIPTLLELGVEAPLREVMGAHADGYVHNTAKAALRDLHLNVNVSSLPQSPVNSGVVDLLTSPCLVD